MLLLNSFFCLIISSKILDFLGSFTALLSPQFRSVVVLLLENVGTGFWKSERKVLISLPDICFLCQFTRAASMALGYFFSLVFTVS